VAVFASQLGGLRKSSKGKREGGTPLTPEKNLPKSKESYKIGEEGEEELA